MRSPDEALGARVDTRGVGVKVFVNGPGRTGNLVLWNLMDLSGDGEVAGVDDGGGDAAQPAPVMEFGSVHCRRNRARLGKGYVVLTGNARLSFTGSAALEALPLDRLKTAVDRIGRFKTMDAVERQGGGLGGPVAGSVTASVTLSRPMPGTSTVAKDPARSAFKSALELPTPPGAGFYVPVVRLTGSKNAHKGTKSCWRPSRWPA